MPIQDYTYVTTQLYQSGSTPNPIIAELPFTRVNFTSQLSSIGAFSGELLLSGVNANAMNVDAGTTPGKVILWVLHGGLPVWSGVIWNREYDSESQVMKINAQEMLSTINIAVSTNSQALVTIKQTLAVQVVVD